MRGVTAALAGAAGGAVLAVAVVFELAATGLLPQPAAQGAAIHGYLMAHPELLAEMSDRLQDQQQAEDDRKAAAALKKIGLKPFFDPKVAFVTGPADAKKSMVEFYDYDCPYCRASQPAVEKFYEAHKSDTRFAFIEFPLSIHGPDALLAAKVSLAARRQPDKFVALHFALMSQPSAVDAKAIFEVAAKVGLDMAKLKADMADPEIEKTLEAGRALAGKAGIDGTPTFIVNGVMHPGAVDEATLDSLAKES